MSEKETRALETALASARMEGLPVTKQTEEDCRRLFQGDLSVNEIVAEILARPARKAG